MRRDLSYFSVCLLLALGIIAGCDPMAPQPTPFPVIITSEPSLTPTPRATDTPTPTATPTLTATPDLAPTVTPFPCEESSGQVLTFQQFRSEIGGGENLRYLAYIPPCYYDLQRRFPYIILLHGLSYREQQWQDIGVVDALDRGIVNGTLPPMILIMPYYGNLGQLNRFPPNPSYETHILNELLPAIERDFCTWNDRNHRAIGGISRGGFWAYSIAFRHPDIFGIVGGHSAFFPESLIEVPAEFNPLDLAQNSSSLPAANLRMYLDNGARDSAAQSQRTLSDRLRARSINHTYVINPVGEHNNDYWASQVEQYLSFYGRDWPRNYAQLPSCLEPNP